jgi:hypothetical protein
MVISTQRTLAIRAPTPTYGAYAPQVLLHWPVAEPDEALDYSLNVADPLNDVEADIVNVVLSVSPSGSGELVASDLAYETDLITVWLAGGVPGRHYRIKVIATTDGNHAFEWIIGLLIGSTLGTLPLAAPPSTGFGAALTWPSGSFPDGVILGVDGAGLIGADGDYLTFGASDLLGADGAFLIGSDGAFLTLP